MSRGIGSNFKCFLVYVQNKMSDNEATTSSAKSAQDKTFATPTKQTNQPLQQPQSQQSSTGSFFQVLPEGAEMALEVEDESSWNDQLGEYESTKSNSLDDGNAAADSSEDGQHPQSPVTSPTYSKRRSPSPAYSSDTTPTTPPHQEATQTDAERRQEEPPSEGPCNAPSQQSRTVEPTLGQLADKEADAHHSRTAPPSATSLVDRILDGPSPGDPRFQEYERIYRECLQRFQSCFCKCDIIITLLIRICF